MRTENKLSRFDECFKLVLDSEGGYSDNTDDKGGKTNWGITEATLNAAFKVGIVSHNNIKDLTVEEAKTIYKVNYWDKCKCDDLPKPLDLYVFDTAVNCGVGTSAKFLQEVINKAVGANILAVDGIIGAMTIGAVEGWLSHYKADCTFPVLFLCNLFMDRRLQYYSNIVAKNGSQLVFLRGWLNRVLKLKEEW